MAISSPFPRTDQGVRIIGGVWRGRHLPVPSVEGLRPTPNRVRETLFNWLGQRLDGQVCLDLFAGSGALGFEAASRGAQRVVMVERHPRLVQRLRASKIKLNAQQIEIIQADALRWITKAVSQDFNIVFLDPPFSTNALARVLRLVLQRVKRSGAVYFEAPEPIDWPGALKGWKGWKEWEMTHQKKAGAVYYHLLHRRMNDFE